MKCKRKGVVGVIKRAHHLPVDLMKVTLKLVYDSNCIDMLGDVFRETMLNRDNKIMNDVFLDLSWSFLQDGGFQITWC